MAHPKPFGVLTDKVLGNKGRPEVEEVSIALSSQPSVAGATVPVLFAQEAASVVQNREHGPLVFGQARLLRCRLLQLDRDYDTAGNGLAILIEADVDLLQPAAEGFPIRPVFHVLNRDGHVVAAVTGNGQLSLTGAGK